MPKQKQQKTLTFWLGLLLKNKEMPSNLFQRSSLYITVTLYRFIMKTQLSTYLDPMC